jgi:hypothetical protein
MRSALLEKFSSNMLSAFLDGKTANRAQKFSERRKVFVRIVWQILYLPPVPVLALPAT